MIRVCVFICLIFSGLFTYGQDISEKTNATTETSSFVFDATSRKVEWQKVFAVDTRISVGSIRDYFVKNKIIITEIDEEKEIYGIIPLQKIDIVKYGHSIWDAPIAFRSVFSADVKIEIKKGRYRVTVSNIYYIDNGDTDMIVRALFMMAPTSKGNKQSLNGSYSFKDDGELRTRTKGIYTILDKYYTDLFTLRIDESKRNF